MIQRLLLLPGLNDASKTELQNLELINNRQVLLPNDNPAKGLSKSLTAYIHKLKAKEWEESLQLETPKDREVVRSVIQPEAGLVLSADPRIFPVKDDAFLHHCRRRLSVKIIHDSHALCHKCRVPLGADLEHVVCCKHVGKNSLHHAVLMTTAAASRTALKDTTMTVETEPSLQPFLRPGRNVEKPRSDIKFRNHVTGKLLYLDFRMQTIKAEATAETPSVQIGEVQKLSFYQTNYDLAAAGAELVAAVIDSYGRWGQQLKQWVMKVARTGSTSDADYARKVNHLRTSIAVAHSVALGKQISDFLRYQM